MAARGGLTHSASNCVAKSPPIPEETPGFSKGRRLQVTIVGLCPAEMLSLRKPSYCRASREGGEARLLVVNAGTPQGCGTSAAWGCGDAAALLEAFVRHGHQTRTSHIFPGKQERRVFYPPSKETLLIPWHRKGGVLSRSPSCGRHTSKESQSAQFPTERRASQRWS